MQSSATVGRIRGHNKVKRKMGVHVGGVLIFLTLAVARSTVRGSVYAHLDHRTWHKVTEGVRTPSGPHRNAITGNIGVFSCYRSKEPMLEAQKTDSGMGFGAGQRVPSHQLQAAL